MIRRIQGFEDFILYYDCESKKCVITVEDAVGINQEYLKNLIELFDTCRHEIDIIGRYVNASDRWDNISDDELRLILDFQYVSDHVRQAAEEELKLRTQRRTGYVYLLQADNGLYKIGQSKVVDNRIKQLGLTLPYELNLVSTIPSVHYKELESHLHEKFADKRVRGEWFELSESDIAYLKELGAQDG